MIRSEQPRDYHLISVVNAITFTHSFGMGEVPLISALRNRKEFDSDLSLVAEVDLEVVGHVLLSPLDVLVRGEAVKAAILAPIAVLPEFQNKGIGTLLIEEGHRRAKEKGIDFIFLLGHPEYYPRFGYHPEMWSSSKIQVQVHDIPLTGQTIEERRVEAGDVEQFCKMWKGWFKDANLAIVPGHSITDWISYGKDIHTSAVLMDGQLSGYLRYQRSNPSNIHCLLAKDIDSFLDLCSYLKNRLNTEELSLPLPYNSQWVEQSGLPIQFDIQAGAVRMMKIINEAQLCVSNYYNDVTNGRISPGQFILPVEFEV